MTMRISPAKSKRASSLMLKKDAAALKELSTKENAFAKKPTPILTLTTPENAKIASPDLSIYLIVKTSLAPRITLMTAKNV
jgi:hypothetical protein